MRYIAFCIGFIFLVFSCQQYSYAKTTSYQLVIYELAELSLNKNIQPENNGTTEQPHVLGGSFRTTILSEDKMSNKYTEIRRYKNNLTRLKEGKSKNIWKIVMDSSLISNAKHQENMTEILRQLNAEEEEKSSPYQERNVAGWKVRIQKDLMGDHILQQRALRELEKQLAKISVRLPYKAVKQLQTVKILLYKNKQGVDENVTAYYSPLYKAVVFHDAKKLHELSNIQNAVVLHELAHGYHDIVLGYDNLEIIESYENALQTGLYKNVKVQGGRTAPEAYALTNDKEYFAELSESYFSTKIGSFENDYYPFNRYDLKKYDYNGYRLAEKMWGN